MPWADCWEKEPLERPDAGRVVTQTLNHVKDGHMYIELNYIYILYIPSSWKVLECPPLGINTEGSRMKNFHCRTPGPVSIVEPWKLL